MKGEVPLDPDFVLPLGKADLKREGKDVTVITYGVCLIGCYKQPTSFVMPKE